VIKPDVMKILQGQPRMLTRDLLAVAVQDLHKICKYYILLVL